MTKETKMKANEIKVGGVYVARVSGRLTEVRVDAIRENAFGQRLVYDVTNLATGRRTTFRSAAKFRSEVRDHRTEGKTDAKNQYCAYCRGPADHDTHRHPDDAKGFADRGAGAAGQGGGGRAVSARPDAGPAAAASAGTVVAAQVGSGGEPDDVEECEICGHDHETRFCDQSLCGRCDQVVDNCDCEVPDEIDAEEWLDRSGR